MSDPLGDGISKVELINHMGDDLMVVNAARVSFNKESKWLQLQDGSDALSMADAKLIKYLARHGHWTPFAHPQLQFRIKMPLFVAREWYRHTVGVTRNEQSGRYVSDDKAFYIPLKWREQAKDKKQGSSERISRHSEVYTKASHDIAEKSLYLYKDMIHEGIAAEMARTVLPQSMYTEFIETGSLYAYARICGLRDQPDAQYEIQCYARAVDELISPLFPVSWKALRGKE